eukprot:3380994-Rhodomonas_salina.1
MQAGIGNSTGSCGTVESEILIMMLDRGGIPAVKVKKTQKLPACMKPAAVKCVMLLPVISTNTMYSAPERKPGQF